MGGAGVDGGGFAVHGTGDHVGVGQERFDWLGTAADHANRHGEHRRFVIRRGREFRVFEIGRHGGGRAAGGSAAPLQVGLGAHDQRQRAAGGDFLVAQPGTIQRLAVELGRLDIDVLVAVALRGDGKGVALVVLLVEVEDRLLHGRAADGVNA